MRDFDLQWLRQDGREFVCGYESAEIFLFIMTFTSDSRFHRQRIVLNGPLLRLLVTPLRKMFGWNWVLKQRRLIGLYAFIYSRRAFTHLAGRRSLLGTAHGDCGCP